MNMRLRDYPPAIAEAFAALEAAEDSENPQDYEAAMERLSKLEAGKDEKLDACCARHAELAAEVEFLAFEIERLELMHKRAKDRLEGWKGYIGACLGVGEKWKSKLYSLSWRPSEAVKIENEKVIPAEYMREVYTYEPDKKKITAALKDGKPVLGATLERRQNLQIK